MKIEHDYNLAKLNTFGISVNAKFFVLVQTEADLKELFNLPEFQQNKKIFLGSGSNVLFVNDFDGIVILNKLKGIEILEENSRDVFIRCMSGEIWHDLVVFAVGREFWGIENLSLIPGTVGAAPMQNIGAYGAELKDVLENVEAYSLQDGEKKVFNTTDCELGYRDSIFKNKLKDKYFISAITLKLSKTPKPNLSYKSLREHLLATSSSTESKIEIKNPGEISDAIVSIRRSRLPDPVVIANAGSFFKNVFVNRAKLEKLLKQYPQMPHFKEGAETKISAAWLIEHTGWKGYKVGKVGVHEKHALVLVNYGGAEGHEVVELSSKIIASVKDKFNLELVPEVNLIL